jgi:hypothetical protein
MRSEIVVLVVIVLAASCGNRDAPQPASVAQVAEGGSNEKHEGPRTIYYNLTDYGWYARAEPMVIEQRPYGPGGTPQPIPLAKLRLAGNYQGVDFYVMHGEREPPGTVYVPVYEGYWLAFVAAAPTGD